MRQLRFKATAIVLLALVAHTTAGTAAALAGHRHIETDPGSFGLFEGNIGSPAAPSWSGQSPDDFRHDPTPTNSEKFGTN